MPKYWGKQIFSLGRFPEVGQKQRTEKERKRQKDKKLVITMASYALQCHLGWVTQSFSLTQANFALHNPF